MNKHNEQKELSQTDMKMVMGLLTNKKEVRFNFSDDKKLMYISIDLSKWSGKNEL